jgi:hypothetical protein
MNHNGFSVHPSRRIQLRPDEDTLPDRILNNTEKIYGAIQVLWK